MSALVSAEATAAISLSGPSSRSNPRKNAGIIESLLTPRARLPGNSECTPKEFQDLQPERLPGITEPSKPLLTPAFRSETHTGCIRPEAPARRM